MRDYSSTNRALDRRISPELQRRCERYDPGLSLGCPELDRPIESEETGRSFEVTAVDVLISVGRSVGAVSSAGRVIGVQRDPLRISFMRVPSELDGRGCAATVTM